MIPPLFLFFFLKIALPFEVFCEIINYGLRQIEKDKYHVISLYVELKNDTNELIYKMEVDS